MPSAAQSDWISEQEHRKYMSGDLTVVWTETQLMEAKSRVFEESLPLATLSVTLGMWVYFICLRFDVSKIGALRNGFEQRQYARRWIRIKKFRKRTWSCSNSEPILMLSVYLLRSIFEQLLHQNFMLKMGCSELQKWAALFMKQLINS